MCRIPAQYIILSVSKATFTWANAMYLLTALKMQNTCCFKFIPANVKNNNAYLKTNVLKNC